jgi:hypothetical protein
MLRIFICPKCRKTYIISRKLISFCPSCGTAMICTPLPYSTYVDMDLLERKKFIEQTLNSLVL